MNEIILCSAIKVSGVNETFDDIYLGARHCHCFIAISHRRKLFNAPDSIRVKCIRGATQGFLTSKQRFVNRIDAYKIAKANNQIKRFVGNGKELYSESLF